MSITTYAELQTAITNWFDDADLATARIQECITLCEGDLQADVDLIETEVRANATCSTTSRYLALPANYISGKRFRLIDPSDSSLVYFVDFTTPNGINNKYTTSQVLPEYVSVNDGQFEFNSIPDKAYTAQYLYSRLVPLSGSNTTNELMPSFMNAYLFGTLKYASIFSKEDPTGYEAEYNKFVKKIQAKNKRKKYPSPLRARSRYGP